MSSFVSAEAFAFSLAIVACHFGVAFFRKAAQNGSGLPNPAFGHNPEASPTRS
jgi:hypothetical protein